jgi:hypothetical protein
MIPEDDLELGRLALQEWRQTICRRDEQPIHRMPDPEKSRLRQWREEDPGDRNRHDTASAIAGEAVRSVSSKASANFSPVTSKPQRESGASASTREKNLPHFEPPALRELARQVRCFAQGLPREDRLSLLEKAARLEREAMIGECKKE